MEEMRARVEQLAKARRVPYAEARCRRALSELASAAAWAATQADPRRAITGYSWFNVALEELDALVPGRTSEYQQQCLRDLARLQDGR